MNKAFAVLLLVLECCSSLSSQQKEEPEIVAIDVISIPYDMEAAAPIRAESIGGSRYAEFFRIADKGELGVIRNRLQLLVPSFSKENCLDSRIVCFMRRIDGDTDTLVFSDYYMRLNESCGMLDTLLVKEFVPYLSNEHQKRIAEYLSRYARSYNLEH